eukprot:CAMPEP_0184725220 /NCGR_PEP_ID=MMETSP0314-20130426/30308_1 /TAXON_ID=38298 /ORGANISM="Rhodella maculata, Strain CCMP 736" /LENGTH=141 /DNA_ID=CAMNT_0027190391 /DNA_START=194 /DNA_END=615 /DNA_ORIENTATION=-
MHDDVRRKRVSPPPPRTNKKNPPTAFQKLWPRKVRDLAEDPEVGAAGEARDRVGGDGGVGDFDGERALLVGRTLAGSVPVDEVVYDAMVDVVTDAVDHRGRLDPRSPHAAAFIEAFPSRPGAVELPNVRDELRGARVRDID